jgi:hypothetical protein
LKNKSGILLPERIFSDLSGCWTAKKRSRFHYDSGEKQREHRSCPGRISRRHKLWVPYFWFERERKILPPSDTRSKLAEK